MGYIRNHAIVVTGTYGTFVEDAHTKAVEIFTFVSNIVDVNLNGSRSFFIPPDGSKEGWEDSNLGDAKRDEFINYLNYLRYKDGGSPLNWAELYFGDDSDESGILREVNKKDKP